MKKFTSVLTAFMFSIFLVNSQNKAELPIIMNFSGYNGANLNQAYPGWNEGKGLPPYPTIAESGWYSSAEIYDSAAAVSLNSNTHDEWIISPQFTATEHSKLTFNVAVTMTYDDPLAGFLGYDDSLTIMVSTDGSNFNSIFSITSENQPGFEMEEFDIELGNFAGQEIQIAFYATDGNMETGYCALHMDNIMIKDDAAKDAKAFLLVSPKSNQCISNAEPIIVSIKNDGYENIYSVPVRVKIRGAATQNIYGVYNGVLEPGDTAVFNLGTADMSSTGDYSLSVFTELIGDQFALNNSIQNINITNIPVQELPSLTLDFTDFYDENLTELYPGWHEARGEGYPTVAMNTDWQANENLGNRAANVYFIFLGTRDWIISPQYWASPNSKLVFDAGIEYDEGLSMGSDDKLAIMISTNCGQSWMELDALDNSTGLTQSFSRFEIPLDAYTGQQFKVAFYATTGEIMDAEKFFIHIDNVALKDVFPNDASVSELLAPLNVCSFSNSETISVTVNNEGENSISNFDIFYQINNETPVNETITETIASNSSYNYSFSQTADLSAANQFDLNVWSALENDDNTTNDTLTATLKTSGFDLAAQGDYTMSFEDDEDFTAWAVENTNGDSKEWELNTESQYANNGNNSMWYSSNGTSTTSNDWLISPCFNLSAGETYYISFYYRNRATAYPEKLKLAYGNTQNSSAMNTDLIDLGTIDNSEYLKAEATLTATNSGEYYFGWQAYGDPDQFACHVDDILIRQQFDNDLALTRATIPRQNAPGSCSVQNGDTIIVTVANLGSSTVTSVPLAVSIDGNPPITQTFAYTLNPGDTADFYFDNSININPSTNYDILIYASLASDENIANDTALLENFLLNNFNMGFEEHETFDNWITENISSSSEVWHLVNDPEVTHSGDYCYGIRTDQEINNDWLYSQCIELEAGKCYSVSFYYRSHYSTENLDLHLGTSPLYASMTDTLLVMDAFNSNDYLHATAQFNVEVTGDYYFGWHTDGGSSSRYWIYIDDIKVFENNNTPAASFTYNVLDVEVAFNSETENVTETTWSFGDGNSSSLPNPYHNYEASGNYEVTLTAIGGCGEISVTDNVLVDCPIEASFTYNIPQNTPNVVEFETTSVADGYLWDFGDNSYSSEQNTTHTYGQTGTFDVYLYTMNQCGVASSTEAIEITEIGVEESILNKGVNVYPNPANKRINLISQQKIKQATIYNSLGKMIFQKQFSGTETTESIKVTELAAGMYMVEIKIEHSKAFLKFMKN